MAIVNLQNVSKYYGTAETRVVALNNVTLGIEQGEFTAIMGTSGSGKSTLMHLAAGLDSVSEGSIWYGNTDITKLGDKSLTLLRRRNVGFIFQSFNLVPTLTALQNIELPFDLDGKTIDATTRQRINDLVNLLGLSERIHHTPDQLSGGQQQRVAIARALAGSPDVIFADEPTGNLDSHNSAEVLRILREAVKRYGQTLVMVTHDPAAAAMADRIIHLRDGVVISDVRQQNGAGAADPAAAGANPVAGANPAAAGVAADSTEK